MKKTVRVAVIGQSEHPLEEIPRSVLDIAYRIGFLIAREGWLLFSGGRDGIMREASRGAKDAGGITVGILPSLDINEANEYVDVPITTGMGMDMRSDLMIHSVDAVVMISGKNGTLNELSTAYMNRKPAVVIEGTGGFADIVKDIMFEGKYLDSRKNAEIIFARTPEEAISKLKVLLGRSQL